MHVEIIGGEFDGMRLILDYVVWEAPDEIRVLERGYTNVIRLLRAAEVERWRTIRR